MTFDSHKNRQLLGIMVIAALAMIGVAVVAADVSESTYTGNSDNLGADSPRGVDIAADGTVGVVGDNSGDNAIDACTLDTAWSLASTSDCKSLSIGAPTTDVEFDKGGDKLYVADRRCCGSSKIYEFNLSDPYNISTATEVNRWNPGDSWNYGSKASIEFSDDGTIFYMYSGGTAYTFSLSDPYNISSRSNTRNSTEIGGNTMEISSDGTTVVTSSSSNTVTEYELSDPWNVSSATQVATYSTSSETGGYVEGVAVVDGGDRMYVTDQSQGAGTVFQYDTNVTGYPTATPTPTPSSSSSEYEQEFELIDHTGEFTDPTLYVDVSLTDYGINPPAGSSDWSQTAETKFDYRGHATVELDNDTLYRLRVHQEDPDGDLRHEVIGYKGDKDRGITEIEIGTNETENATATPNATATQSTAERLDDLFGENFDVGSYNGGLRLTYDGPPVEEVDYNLTGPDGQEYNISRDFDEPTRRYSADLEDVLTGNASENAEDYSVDYNGTYADGEPFNGSEQVEAGGFDFGYGDDSDSSSGGGGGLVAPSEAAQGPSLPELGLGAVAVSVAGFAAYRRFGGP